MEWRKSLQELEENPPTHCWSEISNSLDQDIPAIKKSLYDYSETPPASAKEKIFNTLGNKKQATIIRLTRSKAVAAASISVLLGLTVLYIISSPENKPKVGAAVIQYGTNNTNGNNYIPYTNPNGDQIKISPKLHSVLAPAEHSNDTLIQLWQKKLGKSTYIPAGNNFFDIAEMVKFLEEENR